MKVTHQKNVYYLDLNKNLYRGYIETSFLREGHERLIVYKSSHLEIQEAIILGASEQISFEYFNSKSTKDRAKNGRSARRVEEVAGDPAEDVTGDRTADHTGIHDREAPTLTEVISKCCDSFRIKIPESFLSLSFTLRITFKPSDANSAILWYRPVSSKDKHKEVVACNSNTNSSCVAPYIDTITVFDLYYVIPNTEEVKVVSSGAFKSIKEEDKMIVYLYSAFSHPKYFIFAVGTYDQSDIFNDNDKRKIFIPFSMSMDCSEVQSDLQAFIKYIEGFTRTSELATCNVVFSLIDVGNLVARNLIVLRCSYLPGQRDIEMAYLLKRVLAEALCQQVYHFLNWNIYDAWIYFGLSGFLADYTIRYLLGNNEFMYTYFSDRQFVVREDVLQPPLFYTFRNECDMQCEFFMKKTRLVFHAMEANLSFAFLQKISDELIEIRTVDMKMVDSCYTGSSGTSIQMMITENTDSQHSKSGAQPEEALEAALKRCFTPQFIKIVKDATGKDLKAFFDFYVFKPGLMRVRLQFQINKKKNSVRVNASYTHTSLLQGANRRLLNNVEIKSVELEGNFDHSVTLGGENVFFYHTRTKKKKKEDEEETMPLLYMRADTKRQEIFEYQVEQPDYMHIEQLQDKSVVGQLEAIDSLCGKPTLASCEALERLLDNGHAFHKVRSRAAYALRSAKIEEYDGLQRMIQYFVRIRCVPNSTILKSNEFGLVSYFVQKHLVKSIGQLEIFNGRSEAENIENCRMVLAFLENILNFNDNSLSQFEDAWYISSVINLVSIHSCFLMCYKAPVFESERLMLDQHTGSSKTPDQILLSCIDKLERFRVSDMVFPSNNNVITKISILSYLRLAFYNKISISRLSLESLARYPNLYSIRLVAIEGLILLFSDGLPLVVSLCVSETPFITESILGIILRVMLLNLKVHLVDTDEYEVDLTVRMRQSIAQLSGTFFSIYERYSTYIRITKLVMKILAAVDGKLISHDEYAAQLISRYDYAKEDDNRLSILRIPSATKRLRVSDLQRLRILAFEESYTLRLPRIRNYRPKTPREVPLKSLKIKLNPGRFLVKHVGCLVIRLKTKIKMSDGDIAMILASKYKEISSSEKIDEFVLKSRLTDFFTWEPLTSDRILELVHGGLGHVRVYEEIERVLIFVLSYNLVASKMYQAAKMIYSYIENVFFSNALIREQMTPMTAELRETCTDLINRLIANPEYAVFRSPVDTSELKNYLDIVRVPVCLDEISGNLDRYESFEAFIMSLERVCMNCMRYNDNKSLIVETAVQLQDEIRRFRGDVTLEPVETLDVLKEVIGRCNVENLLDSIEVSSLRSWGELESELVSLKKKYTRSSHNGKLVIAALKSLREQLWGWFLFDGVRVLIPAD